MKDFHNLRDAETAFELRRYSDEEIDKFVARAQSPKSQKNLRDIVSDDSISQMEGSEIYQTVNTTLQTLLYSEKMWDLKTYWEDAMKTIQEGITFMQQAEQGARLMRLWALGISKTVKEFNIEKDAAIQEIFEKASKIANAPVKEDDGKIKINISKELIRSHFPNANAVAVIKEPKRFMNELEASIGAEMTTGLVHYFYIDGELKTADNSPAMDLNFAKFITND